MNDYAAPRSDVHESEFDALPDAEERQWGMIAHLSSLSWYVTGVGMFLGPLIVWAMKKDESEFVAECGKEAMNFAISALIWIVASFVMFFTVILAPVSFVIWIFGWLFVTIMPIIAGVKANAGEVYRYPLTFRFIR